MHRLTICLLYLFVMSLCPAQAQGIIDNAKSPHAKLKSINIGECQWTSGFWADKFKLCEEVMVPHMGTLLKGDTGHAYNNFKIAAGLKTGKHQGMFWHDGDFYKWMESAMYVYAINKDGAILAELDEMIEVIGKAQEQDGYLSTQITLSDSKTRWSYRQHHELYNSGHLLTSACIHHRVTGKRNFLDIAIKHADYLYRTFRPQPKELARFGFNQTQIMGLVELYRTTRNKEYLHLAEIFINMRGKTKVQPDSTVWYKAMGDMVQERTPLRRSSEAVGHAVPALYYYAGAADVYAETGEIALIKALDRLWDDVVNKKMYVTGAVGQTHHGASSKVDFVPEAFISEYMMPNLTAYNETCANICNAMFSYRMLGIHGESKYGDIMELVLYNSALSGISAEGTHYFYTNPLRRTLDHAMDRNGSSNYPFSGVKATQLEGGIRVPGIVVWPGKLSPGSVYDRPLSTLDLLPTLLKAGGGDPASIEGLDGVDMLPFLQGVNKARPHPTLYWKMEMRAAIRDGDWKMLRYPDRPAELFHIVNDRAEQDNLATEHSEKVQRLYKKLFEWELTLERPLFQLRRQEEGWSSRRRDEFRKPPLATY